MRQRIRYLFYFCQIWLLCAVSLASAQTEDVSLNVDRVDDQTFPNVRVFASVRDGQGHSVADLGVENFSLTDANGNQVPIGTVETVPPAERPVRVVMALDISGSIKDSLEQIKNAAGGFVEKLEPNDQVALVYFGTEVYDIEDFTTDHGKVINQINTLNPGRLEDFTALYNGAVRSIRMAASGRVGRPAVVLMTDGRNTNPAGVTTLSLSDVQRESSDKGVPIYVIGVQSGDISDEDLRLMASNGSYYPVDQTEQLNSAYDMVAQDLRQQYAISFVANQPADGNSHSFVLTSSVPELGTQSAPMGVVARQPPPTPTSEGGEPLPPGEAGEPPQVELVDPPDEITLDEEVEIEAKITPGGDPRPYVELFLDDKVIAAKQKITREDWTYRWTPDKDEIETGEQELRIVVTDANDQQNEATHTVEVVEGGLSRWIWIAAALAALVLVLVLVFFLRSQQNKAQQGYDQRPYQPDPPVWNQNPQPDTLPYSQNVSVTTLAPGAVTTPPGQQGGGVQPTALASGAQPNLTEPVRPSKPQVLAKLIIQRGKSSQQEVSLSTSKPLYIGRDAQKAELVLDDSRVSAQHACVRFQNDGFAILDLGSTNGMYMNGKRIMKVRLQDGDQIEIGNSVLLFRLVKMSTRK